jgi:rare lipoprotein A
MIREISGSRPAQALAAGIVSLGLTIHPVSGGVTASAALTTRLTESRPSIVGLASWYGSWHQGRPTASGETYDMRRLTAAHRTIPFGTLLRVTNLENGRHVVVRVTDRGPYVAGRLLDLSLGAAEALGMVAAGVVPVAVIVLGKGT